VIIYFNVGVRISIMANHEGAMVKKLTAWKMKSIWEQEEKQK